MAIGSARRRAVAMVIALDRGGAHDDPIIKTAAAASMMGGCDLA